MWILEGGVFGVRAYYGMEIYTSRLLCRHCIHIRSVPYFWRYCITWIVIHNYSYISVTSANGETCMVCRCVYHHFPHVNCKLQETKNVILVASGNCELCLWLLVARTSGSRVCVSIASKSYDTGDKTFGTKARECICAVRLCVTYPAEVQYHINMNMYSRILRYTI